MYLNDKQLTTYTTAIHRAEQWALNNFERLVAEKDLQGHYKGPYFWASVGNMKMAAISRRMIVERFLRDDGDFRMADDVKGFTSFPCTALNQYIYPNGWIITGMMKTGAYDIARKAMEFLLKFQDPRHGGFYYSFDPKTKSIDKRLMDSSSTSSAGVACLACGKIDEARRAGDFILRLLQLQPEPDTYFFSCMKQDGSLHTDVMGIEDQWDANSRKQKCLSTKHNGLNELTWLIGKPTKFLTRLYTATGDQKYLDGARQCFWFFHKLDEQAWVNYASCKTMWAGAELYRITGEKAFAETATRLLDFYCRTQTDAGCWVHTLWYKSEADQSFSWTSDITCEYGGEFSDVVYDLCAR